MSEEPSPMLTPQEMAAILTASPYGFTYGDQLADLGLSRDWLTYLVRQHGGQHQYLWLTSHEGTFVEALLFVYTSPLRPRARPPMVPIHAGIYRSMEEIEVAVDRVY